MTLPDLLASDAVPLGAIELPGGDTVPVAGQRFGPAGAPTVVLAGLHGDAAEGVAAAMALAARWAWTPPTQPVLVFACLNPLAVLHGSRRWPGLDVDFAERLPGDAAGHAPDRIAAALYAHLRGAARIVELGAPDAGLWESTTAEVWQDTPVPGLPVPFVRHGTRAPSGSPGAYGAIRLRGGRTGRVHPAGVESLVGAVLAVLDGGPSTDPGWEVRTLTAEAAGVFVPLVEPGRALVQGEPYGMLAGTPCLAPTDGLLIALRDTPTAFVGTPLARIAAHRSLA